MCPPKTNKNNNNNNSKYITLRAEIPFMKRSLQGKIFNGCLGITGETFKRLLDDHFI